VNLTDLRTEIKRLTGRNESGFEGRIDEAVNRALRQWAVEFPWEGLKLVGDITHLGGRELTFPRHVSKVIWVADKTNNVSVEASTRQWDREHAYSYTADQTGYADEWEPAGISPLLTNVSNAISLLSSDNTDNRVVYLTGLAYRSGGTDVRDLYEASLSMTLSGATGVTLGTDLVHVESVSVSDYDSSGAVITVNCGGGVVGVIGPGDKRPQHQKIRFFEIPAANTVFRYGALTEPRPLVNASQSAPPEVDSDYLIWGAVADISWQLREGDRAQMAKRKAQQIANERRARERMFGDYGSRIVPEDLT
jgi:hypothetical protein